VGVERAVGEEEGLVVFLLEDGDGPVRSPGAIHACHHSPSDHSLDFTAAGPNPIHHCTAPMSGSRYAPALARSHSQSFG
jgi:hypothetical protein